MTKDDKYLVEVRTESGTPMTVPINSIHQMEFMIPARPKSYKVADDGSVDEINWMGVSMSDWVGELLDFIRLVRDGKWNKRVVPETAECYINVWFTALDGRHKKPTIHHWRITEVYSMITFLHQAGLMSTTLATVLADYGSAMTGAWGLYDGSMNPKGGSQPTRTENRRTAR